MKKLITLTAALFLIAFHAVACENSYSDRPITMDQLPATAQTFLTQHFAQYTISFITEDRDGSDRDYDVVFENGATVEFNRKGEWKSIDFRRMAIPQSAVPQQISAYITANHPNNFIVELDRDRRHHEAKLNNGLEIKFDRNFNVVEYDH